MYIQNNNKNNNNNNNNSNNNNNNKIITVLIISILLVLKTFVNKLKHLLTVKTLKQIFFRIQAYDLIMCGYLCFGFIDFMLKGKTLTEYTIFFHQIALTKMKIQF